MGNMDGDGAPNSSKDKIFPAAALTAPHAAAIPVVGKKRCADGSAGPRALDGAGSGPDGAPDGG